MLTTTLLNKLSRVRRPGSPWAGIFDGNIQLPNVDRSVRPCVATKAANIIIHKAPVAPL